MAKRVIKKTQKSLRWHTRLLHQLLRPYRHIRDRIQNLKSRRPHRSFRWTRRRDYRRSLKLPGYWAFTLRVFGRLMKHKRLFGGIILIYTLLSVVFGSMTAQSTYKELAELLQQGSADVFEGSWGTIGEAGILAFAAFSGSTSSLSETQQVYIVLIALLTWLTTVWLLREILADRTPKIRDGLYNSAAPLISTVLVVVYLLVQLLPIGLLAGVYGGLASVGLLESGFGTYLFSGVAVIVASLSLYWVTYTFIALVVITLPGMYPAQALRAAGDLVVGRRLRIMYRIIWMMLIALIAWLVVMIPIVLIDSWVRSAVEWAWLDYVPFVPFIAALISSAVAVWAASYVYLLYREVVADDASPA